MDIFLVILSGLLIVIGLVGSVVPVLPGPPLSWAGILLIHLTTFASFSSTFLWVTAIMMIVITILDYYVPIWGTKKFGGTRKGVIGSTLGLLVGLFIFPPFGIIIGPFVGAFVGEMLANRDDTRKALKSATGSFLGFVLGTGMKLAFGGVMFFYYIRALL